MMYIEEHVQTVTQTKEREMIYSVIPFMKINVSGVEIMYYCHVYDSGSSAVNVWCFVTFL